MGSSHVAAFQPSDTESQVIFATIDDAIPEPDEVFQMQLQATDTETVIGSQNMASITIVANDNAAGVFGFQVSLLCTTDCMLAS